MNYKRTRSFGAKLRQILFVLALAATLNANALSILYYNDLSLGTDRMGQALTDLAGTHTTTTASSPSDFATQIAGGGFQLGIFMQQNSSGADYDNAAAALAAFVAGGGKAIYTDWTKNAAHVTPFGVSWTGEDNDSAFNVTDPSLAVGLSNPVNLSNPGWGVFSMDVSSSDIAATFLSDGDGAIAFGAGRNSIVNGFLTDTFVDGAEGVQLYKNEIGYLAGAASVPDAGSTLLCLAIGLLGLGFFHRKVGAAKC